MIILERGLPRFKAKLFTPLGGEGEDLVLRKEPQMKGSFSR